LDVGRRLFDLRGPRLHTHVADARPWLRASDRRFDVVYVDAYRQPYIPFYLATREFFALVRDRLDRSGVVVINVGHPEDSDRLEQMLTAGLRTAFAHVARDPITRENTLLIASDVAPSSARVEAALPSVPPLVRRVLARTAADLAPGLAGGPVYTDDKAPVEWLIDRSIITYAADH
jgi:hypothetical protein